MKRPPLPREFLFSLIVLVRSGIPLHRALETLQSAQPDPRRIKWIERIRLHVEAGDLFSESLRKTVSISPFILQLIALGEQTGKLTDNLELAARYLQEIQAAKQKTASSLIYPAFILIVSMLAVVLLVKLLLPTFLPVFNDLHGKLPLPTRLLIGLNDFFSFPWCALPAVLSAGIYFAAKNKANHRFMLSMPVIGKILKLLFSVQLCRTVAASHKAGLAIDRSLGLFAPALSNPVFRSFVLDLRLALIRGEPLSNLLSGRRLIPPYVGPMAAVAENTGKTAELFSRCAFMAEEEIHDQLRQFTAALEPMILGGLGIFVGFILTGIFSPLYKMLEALA